MIDTAESFARSGRALNSREAVGRSSGSITARQYLELVDALGAVRCSVVRPMIFESRIEKAFRRNFRRGILTPCYGALSFI
jgi:hypothetical protein